MCAAFVVSARCMRARCISPLYACSLRCGQIEKWMVEYWPILKVGAHSNIQLLHSAIAFIWTIAHFHIWSFISHFFPLHSIKSHLAEEFLWLKVIYLVPSIVMSCRKYILAFFKFYKKRDHYHGVVRKVMQPLLNNGLFHCGCRPHTVTKSTNSCNSFQGQLNFFSLSLYPSSGVSSSSLAFKVADLRIRWSNFILISR